MATIRRRGKKFEAMVIKGQHSQSKTFSTKDSDNGQKDNRAGNLVYAKWPVKSELPLHDHFHAPSNNQSRHHASNLQAILEKRKRHNSG
jgi:hypothetical protein